MTQIRCQEGQELFFDLKPETKPTKQSIADQPKKRSSCLNASRKRVKELSIVIIFKFATR